MRLGAWFVAQGDAWDGSSLMAATLQPPPIDVPQEGPDGLFATVWQRFFLSLRAISQLWTQQPFLVFKAAPDLKNPQNLGALASGYLKILVAGASATTSTVPTIPISDISGVLPVASGGTGDTTLALNGVLYGNVTSPILALSVNATATRKFLEQDTSGAPNWSALVAGDIPDISATYSLKAGNAALVTVGTLTSGATGAGFTIALSTSTVTGTLPDARLSANVPLLTVPFATYNGIATVGNGVPAIYAAVNTTGLTANVGASILYAVPSTGEGLYRVSAYVVETVAGSVSSVLPNVQIIYTDKDSNVSVTIDATPILGAAGLGQTGALNANAGGTVSSGVVPIYVKASTTIQYQTSNYASVAAGMTYALRIRLEAL